MQPILALRGFCEEMSEQKGDPRFRELLNKMWETHCKKSADYGLPAWLGTLVRLNDKVKRLQTYAKKRTLANEGVEDTLLDLACYALLVLILHREAHKD